MKFLPGTLVWSVFCSLLFSHLSCTRDPAPSSVAPEVTDPIERAIIAHGMEGLDSLHLSFTFRDRDYTILNDAGRYRYTRAFIDSLNRSVMDELTNDEFRRSIGGKEVTLTQKDSAAYASSVNSVRYFVMLPFTLRDPAVITRELPPVTIEDQEHDRVEVTFRRAGGGEDFDDVYHYFFNTDTGELDYLAYAFEVEDGGIRFRKAVNKRRVEGVLVQDYINFGLDGDDRDLEGIITRYSAGELPELSIIENENFRVE